MGKTIRRGGRESFHLNKQRKQSVLTKERNRGYRNAIKALSFENRTQATERPETDVSTLY